MAIDEERRDVARRLRGLEPCLFDDGEYIDCGEVEEAIGLVNDDGAWYRADGVMRLADLIEPDISGHNSGHRSEMSGHCPEMSGIDRDALLELADELERAACYRQMRGELCAPIGVRVIREYICRIREAVGDDNAR